MSRCSLWIKRLFSRSGPEPEEDGGVRHYLREDAPKEIRSTQITSFACTFSTLDICLEDSPIAGHVLTLQADPEGGCFRQRYGQTWTFVPDAAFFARLQQLVSRYALAQYNGEHYTVSGLPPDCGMTLAVRYASGESISASNNQSCFVPLEALEALTALFQNQTGGK